MPSWAIHISLANKLKKEFNLDDNFILGNVLPDATNGFVICDISNIIAHSITHYNHEGTNKPPKNDVQEFLKTYENKLSNSIILGYYIHLLTDNYYNNYTIKNHIANIDNKKAAILNDGSIDYSITPWKLKQKDFSIFGDYLIYYKKLGNKIFITDNTIKLIEDLNYKITQNDLELIINKINSLINKDVKKIYKYKMFSEAELINLFNNCYKYLSEILRELINSKKEGI